MRLVDSLVRIVLCATLVLNGPTLAAAAVHHAVASAETATAGASDHAAPPAEAIGGCHEEAQETTDSAGSGKPECCKTSNCAGVCMISVSANVAALVLAPTMVEHAGVADAVASSFVSFEPHPSIRPPIAG